MSESGQCPVDAGLAEWADIGSFSEYLRFRKSSANDRGAFPKAIVIAVDILGSRLKLAEICGVSHTVVNKWLKGGGISVIYAKKSKRQPTVKSRCVRLRRG